MLRVTSVGSVSKRVSWGVSSNFSYMFPFNFILQKGLCQGKSGNSFQFPVTSYQLQESSYWLLLTERRTRRTDGYSR